MELRVTVTITSAQDFLEIFNIDDRVVASDRMRFCEASEEVWLEIIALHPELKEAVLLNKKLPTGVLETLSRDSDPRIRYETATKRRLPLDVMTILARDPDVSVRQRIVYNGSATREVLQLLALDTEEHIASTAKERLESRNFRVTRLEIRE